MASRQRSPRAAACGVILLVVLGTAGCRRTAVGPEIDAADVECQLGLAGAFDRTRWNLLRVKVKNRGEDFRGTLEVVGLDVDGRSVPPVYRLELDVPGHLTAVKEAAFPIRPEEWFQVRLGFQQPGFSSRIRFEASLGEEDVLRVLVIGQGAPDIAAGIPGAPWKTHRARPDELPAHSRAYDPFQLVVLWGTALAGAPSGALEALGRWVEGGGTLVAFPGGDWGASLPRPCLALLGVVPGDPEASLPHRLATRLGEAAGSGFYRELSPAPGAVPVGDGVAIRSSPGAGSVTTFTFRPSPERFAEAATQGPVHEALAEALESAVSFPGDAAAGLRAMERVSPETLSAMAGLHPPPRSSVIAALAVYLAAGFFLPAVLFRRKGRREWTFLVVTLSAVVATVGIYRYGLLSGLKASEMDEVTVLRVHADGAAAEATSFLGIVSPGMERLSFEGPAGLPQPLRGAMDRTFRGIRSQIPLAPITLEAPQTDAPRLLPLSLYPSTMLCLRWDYRFSVAELLSLRRQDGGGGGVQELVLENRGRSQMELFLRSGERRAALGHVAPGNAKAVATGESVSWLPVNTQQGWRPPGEADILDALPPKGTYLVAVINQPVFPAPKRILNRKAKTVIVIAAPEEAP